MSKIIFDMDGTLNEWDPAAGPDKAAEKGYMLDRPPVYQMVDAARILWNEGFEIWIESAVFPYDYAVLEKCHWIDRVMPYVKKEHRIFVPYGSSKGKALKEVAGKGDIFVDDFTKNLEDVWHEFDGRVFCVKCVTDINDTHHSWDGARVSIHSSAPVIAMTLRGFATILNK